MPWTNLQVVLSFSFLEFFPFTRRRCLYKRQTFQHQRRICLMSKSIGEHTRIGPGRCHGRSPWLGRGYPRLAVDDSGLTTLLLRCLCTI
jgi:hypothetical protein